MFNALAIAAGVLGVCFAAPAFAVLGGEPLTAPQGASTATTKATARGRRIGRVIVDGDGQLHGPLPTTLASGTVINEYLSSGGTVFGIAWHGSHVPDLATLLGTAISRNSRIN